MKPPDDDDETELRIEAHNNPLVNGWNDLFPDAHIIVPPWALASHNKINLIPLNPLRYPSTRRSMGGNTGTPNWSRFRSTR